MRRRSPRSPPRPRAIGALLRLVTLLYLPEDGGYASRTVGPAGCDCLRSKRLATGLCRPSGPPSFCAPISLTQSRCQERHVRRCQESGAALRDPASSPSEGVHAVSAKHCGFRRGAASGPQVSVALTGVAADGDTAGVACAVDLRPRPNDLARVDRRSEYG
jgi:hypothetical protein